jgi:hypothetical protein
MAFRLGGVALGEGSVRRIEIMLCRKSLTRVKAAVLALAVAGFSGLGVSSATAAPVPLPANATLSTLIGLNGSGGVQIGNFIYSDFSYAPTTFNPSNPTPTAAQVSVTTASGAFGPNSGLTFSTIWESIPGGNQDAFIRYAVQAVSGTVTSVGLAFNGATPLASGGTFASVTETVSTLVTSGGLPVGPGTQIGQISALNNASSGVGTNSGPLVINPGQTGIFVSKDISTVSGTGGIATISFVDNTYLFVAGGPIPEPASIAMLGIVAAGMLVRRRRTQA